MESHEIEEARKAAEMETGCDVELDVAREEATWYSLVNAIALCLGSGMGNTFDDAGARELLSWSGVNWDDLPQRNAQPLESIYKSGDPHLIRAYDESDLDSWRWSADSFDRTLVPQAQGWTILAETECAKWLAIPLSNESIPDSQRIWWESYGRLFWALARKQCDFAFNNLRDDRGLFCRSRDAQDYSTIEPGTELTDQACMLWACSDIAALAADGESVYANDVSRGCFMRFADMLFEAIVNNKDELLASSGNPIQAQSIAIPALTWYAATTEAQDLKARCFWLLREYADNLVKAQEANDMVGSTLVDAAAALRALTEAFRVTRLRTYAETAVQVFNYLESQWFVLSGLYAQSPLSAEYTYNADDIGVILGALNASRLFLGDRVDREIADLRLRIFFCKAVNTSGLQTSMPSPNFMPGWLHEREPNIHFRYPTIPFPWQANGEYGVAPVLAGEVGYDPQTQVWSRRLLFDAPAAMHACCEMLWVNCIAINAYPDVKLERSPTAVQQAAGSAG